ncbi:MAG: sugar phosphate isomerase/epimerase family protein [Trueperaceae bacterium]
MTPGVPEARGRPPLTPGPGLERLSLNTATVRGRGLLEAVDACARAGVPWIAPWREQFEAVKPARAGRAIADAGLRVSSLCRGGFFPAASAAERRERIDDNLRAIDEAAELGADVLVLVCGGLPDRDLQGARQMVADGIAAIEPHARARGVRLGIEPLHPMFAADRSVITTLGEARALAARLDSPAVGVIVDAYHVWWDPRLSEEIAAAARHTLGFHVSDWIVPLPDVLDGRGMMGDGVIDLRGMRRQVDAAGYRGPIEVEIFNQALRDRPLEAVLATMVARYREAVLDDEGADRSRG